jgi:integrase
MVQTGATFADAAAEWLRYVEHDRGRKPSTVAGYRSIVGSELLPRFGEMALKAVTTSEIESWQRSMTQAASTQTKALVLMRGIFERARKVWSLAVNPVADVEKPTLTRSGDLQVFSPEEVWALVRAATSEADNALFLTAAFMGLRMGELLALCWRDVDFTGSTIRVRNSYCAGNLTTPKSGKVRAVPLAPDVAGALAQLGQRQDWVGDDDLVFAGAAGDFLDGSALRRRYKAALAAAGLRPLRFHDLRHTFGTRMIAKADIRRVQEWMGHADIHTTMRYLHYAPRDEDAAWSLRRWRLRGRRPLLRSPSEQELVPATRPRVTTEPTRARCLIEQDVRSSCLDPRVPPPLTSRRRRCPARRPQISGPNCHRCRLSALRPAFVAGVMNRSSARGSRGNLRTSWAKSTRCAQCVPELLGS